jgi:hypothetical protein
MTAIVTNYQSLAQVFAFKQYILQGHCYLGIGKSTAWTDEQVPDIPSFNNHTQDIADLIAIKKVNYTDIHKVVPRVDWTSGKTYVTGNYVLTEDYNVYLCKNSPGVASTTKPTSTNKTTPQTIGTYQWQFLYTVGNTQVIDFLTTSWLPVYGWTGDTNPLLDSYDPCKTLQCKHLAINATLGDTDAPDFSDSISYRKIFLIDSPVESNNTTLCTASTYSVSEISPNSGFIFYKDYRKLTQRAPTQKEAISIVIEF